MSPVGLEGLLATLPKNDDPNLLVGFETSDDAGVYRLDEQRAIVTTADFITPPVDDPHTFGQIAAANALSDVYAMGGKPLLCLNLAAFPTRILGPEILAGIVSGALSKITEAGARLVGGHTIEDDEPKFGLAVTGLVDPERFWSNATARPGDLLLLTKPIGSGVIFNAARRKKATAEHLAACIEIVSTLNRAAAEVMARFPIHAATDVTGFGLAGHAFEMARAAGVTFEIDYAALPIMAGALAAYRRGISSAANPANRRLVGRAIEFLPPRPAWEEELLFDPQTSGGLLAAVPEAEAPPLLAELHSSGVTEARIIGRVTERAGETLLKIRSNS